MMMTAKDWAMAGKRLLTDGLLESVTLGPVDSVRLDTCIMVMMHPVGQQETE